MVTGTENALRAIAPHHSRRVRTRLAKGATMATGAAMLVWSGAIHLHLWTHGYRSIPTIGWLFLLQAITAFVLGALVIILRRAPVAAAGALFLASTIAGLIWSVEWGLFGFQDSFNAPFATESLGVEAGGAAVLAIGCLLARRRH